MHRAVMIAAAVVGVMLAGCNTVEGAGKDLNSAGKAVSKTAHDIKN